MKYTELTYSGGNIYLITQKTMSCRGGATAQLERTQQTDFPGPGSGALPGPVASAVVVSYPVRAQGFPVVY